jgi:two-component system phosphate regulon sensor histidine kinase PhoR
VNKSWSNEIWRLAALLFVGLVVGLLSGQLAMVLLLIVSAYLVWHLYNLHHLGMWLQGKRTGMPEVADGAWSDIYYHLYRLQQRNRRRKKRLATMVNRFRESTNALPDAAVVLSASGNIENWNKKAAELLNLKSTHDAGQPITNLIRAPEFISYLNRSDYSEPLRMKSPLNEAIHLSLQIVPYGNKQRLLMVRDITRLYRLEQIRKDFIANVSHELRTPLTVISGYLESLQEKQDEWAGENSKILNSMMQQTLRMQNIVTDLLLISRLETDEGDHKKQQVDVPAVLEMIVEDAGILSAGRHKIQLKTDRMLCLQANYEEVVSVFSNLIYNAVKYTPAGGEINIHWYADERGAWFEVEDNGPGIAPEHIPRLTERFYRIDVGRSRETGGTGLGLAIVKHVLNRHQGSLEIKSELGKGSIFRCYFPASLAIEKEVA